MGLVSELRRRNVLRMAVLYAAAAWLIMQVGEVVVTLAALPDWSGQVILILLVIGFPIALIFSWFYELTPEGLSLEKDVAPGESITHVTGRRMDFIVISLLSAALLLFAWHTWWPSTPMDKSIAVLAFENMSDDPRQEYFSDGISEELLNTLAQIPELRVISRSSAYSFKGKDIAIPTVAEQLGVAHVLEGSVRKVGNRVRITAQLVEARSDSHLWSDSYDRELDDIFAVQDEIATAVVDALKITLLGKEPKAPVTNPEVYSLFLQARYIGDQGTVQDLETAIDLYHRILKMDQHYVPAWDGLAQQLINKANRGLLPGEGYEPARQAAFKAIAIDPDYGRSHGHLGWIALFQDGDLHAAAGHYQRALALEPTELNTLGGAANLLGTLGRVEEAIAVGEYIVSRDPVGVVGHYNLGIRYLHLQRLDQAIESLRTTLDLSKTHAFAHCLIGMALLLQGETEAALDAINQEPFEVFRLIGLALVHHELGNVDESDAALDELIEQHSQGWAYNIAYILAYRRSTDAAFEWLEKAVDYKDGGLADITVQPFFENLHDDARWNAFLEKIGRSKQQLAAIDFTVDLPQ